MEPPISLSGALRKAGPSGFGYNSTAEQVSAGLDLSGRRFLVTGCSSGLGAETMRVLALRGGTVVGAARTMDKAQAACQGVARAVPVACELSEPAHVAACVEALRAEAAPLDAIICNAGIMALPERTLKHGYELQFLTNHIGHFILVTGLLDQLADDGRVVMLSSGAHKRAPPQGVVLDDLACERQYTPWGAYGQSKIANLLFARELARRFVGSSKVANGVHPGVIATNLGRHMSPALRALFGAVGPLMLKSVAQGAATTVWAAVHPDTASIRGEYLKDCNVGQSSAIGQDMDLAGRLWTESERIVAQLLPGG